MLEKFIRKKDISDLREFIHLLKNDGGERLLFQNDLLLHYFEYCDRNEKEETFRLRSSVREMLNGIQEFFFIDGTSVFKYRYSVTRFGFFRLGISNLYLEAITADRYLDSLDSFFLGKENKWKGPRIDYLPFYDYSPNIRDSKNIGNGIRFLNRYLSSKLFNDPEKWNRILFDFLNMDQRKGTALLIDKKKIKDFPSFYRALKRVRKELDKDLDENGKNGAGKIMRSAGLEKGWGNSPGRIRETVGMLLELINSPDDMVLEEFISRVPAPMISRIAVISPHGWFGQENVLGLPDTGGQVIYILDQVKALEKFIRESHRLSGIDIEPKIVVVTRLIPDSGNTTCHIRREKINGTDNCWILRVPFTDDNYDIVREWISRFEIWKHLDRFADDVYQELTGEFQGSPDLVIGNYSDGNLVASLISDKFNVIQCTIAHALEKNKYPGSDIRWKEYEDKYNFSLQFIADIISMNKSDFIITSTFQEIAGSENSQGQYESYLHFSLPGLFQVKNGINLHAPKFNVIPPGVDENVYFPYFYEGQRDQEVKKKWIHRILNGEPDDPLGKFEDPEKRIIFSMARLDKVKNLSGLVEAYGISGKLRDSYNLVIAGGTVNIEESKDIEEQEEIRKIRSLIGDHGLKGHIRLLPSIKKAETGEVYRIVADSEGIFVQPALFEAFGLTILEAMVSGLPTFGPKFGGPGEIIEFGKNGFLMNTGSPQLIAASLEKFLDRCSSEKDLWDKISKNGIRRVSEDYNWKVYSRKLIDLAKLYGFWRFSETGKGKEEMNRYTDLIYYFLMKKRIEEKEKKSGK